MKSKVLKMFCVVLSIDIILCTNVALYIAQAKGVKVGVIASLLVLFASVVIYLYVSFMFNLYIKKELAKKIDFLLIELGGMIFTIIIIVTVLDCVYIPVIVPVLFTEIFVQTIFVIEGIKKYIEVNTATELIEKS